MERLNRRGLQAGETVLTLGSGGVSLFALQFAKLFGTRVLALTSSDEKAARLKALGADHTIVYSKTPDWHQRVRELTGGRGIDHIVEVGGPGSYENTVSSVAPLGEISLVAPRFTASGAAAIDANVLFRSVSTLRVIAVGSRAQFMDMNRAIEANRMRPVIDRIFPFDDALEAFRYYEAGKNFGKVVIVGT